MHASTILAFLSLAAFSAAAPIIVENHSGHTILAAVSRTNGEDGNDAYFPIENGKSERWERDGPNETLFIAQPDVTGSKVSTFYVTPGKEYAPFKFGPEGAI